MASSARPMAAALSSRFHRRERGDSDHRVGEILSDSNSEVSSIDDVDDERVNRRAPPDRKSTRVLSDSDGSDAAESPAVARKQAPDPANEAAVKVHQRPAPLQTMKRKNSKWYDSDDDGWERPPAPSDGGDRQQGARSKSERSQRHSDRTESKHRSEEVNNQHTTKTDVLSPESSGAQKAPEPGGRRSSFQRLVDKTFNLSPFGSKRKALDVASPASSGPDTPRGNSAPSKPVANTTANAIRSPLSDASSTTEIRSNNERRPVVATRARANTDTQGGGVLSDQASDGFKSSPDAITSRRKSNAIQSPGGGDMYSGTSDAVVRRGSELPTGPLGDAMSPGQRKVPGAFPGRPGSGVLLEGWLRQKQRRGVKGMKKWNSRYFVLYAKTNEVRYYADVVQSAWGPIPLGEMGSISLRLIQRIGKPGTLKYKGCRLDITCRNSWGTHYADDYVSSDDENAANNNATDRSNSTPKSSRVYSLMADSPQTTGAWFSTLDSLLVRSANSPRVDVAPSSGSSASAKQLKRANSMATTKMMTRRRSNTLDSETVVLAAPGDSVPKPVLLAINFIFDSTPGIETEQFYKLDAEPHKLKMALKFLNQFATDTTRRPTKDELEQVLDAVTAGGIVRLWLKQLEQPLVPFEMFDDFRTLAVEAKTAPFELLRNLKALVAALPRRHLAMLACLLFHLNDVNVYASKNGMDAATLARVFGEFILRPRSPSSNQEDADTLLVVVEEMIAHVDAIIDEKESEVLDRV